MHFNTWFAFYDRNGEEWFQQRQLLTQAILKDTGKFLEAVLEPVPNIVLKKVRDWSNFEGGYITSFEQDCYELFLASKFLCRRMHQYSSKTKRKTTPFQNQASVQFALAQGMKSTSVRVERAFLN